MQNITEGCQRKVEQKNQSLILIIGIKLNACWFVVNGLIPLTNLCWYIVCIKRRKFFKKIVDKSEKNNLDEYILHEVINIKAYSDQSAQNDGLQKKTWKDYFRFLLHLLFHDHNGLVYDYNYNNVINLINKSKNKLDII